MVQITPLSDRRDHGNCLLKDRLNTLAIAEMFGKGALDFPFDAPWGALVEKYGSDNLQADCGRPVAI